MFDDDVVRRPHPNHAQVLDDDDDNDDATVRPPYPTHRQHVYG
jgi:hypothetical protein